MYQTCINRYDEVHQKNKKNTKDIIMNKILSLTLGLFIITSCQAETTPNNADNNTSATEQTTTASANPTMDDKKDMTVTKDIVDTAMAAGTFNTLASALKAANLVDTLKGEGPFTVFAPTDEAFAALPEGTLDNLLANPEELAKVLTYHVVPGMVSSEEVVKLNSAKSVEGSEISITVKDGKVMANNATVVTTDIKASNGIIHVIDAVILPPSN